MHKVAHEAGKRADQVERIGRLGGVVAPILNQGDVLDFGLVAPELGKVPKSCAVPRLMRRSTASGIPHRTLAL